MKILLLRYTTANIHLPKIICNYVKIQEIQYLRLFPEVAIVAQSQHGTFIYIHTHKYVHFCPQIMKSNKIIIKELKHFFKQKSSIYLKKNRIKNN